MDFTFVDENYHKRIERQKPPEQAGTSQRPALHVPSYKDVQAADATKTSSSGFGSLFQPKGLLRSFQQQQQQQQQQHLQQVQPPQQHQHQQHRQSLTIGVPPHQAAAPDSSSAPAVNPSTPHFTLYPPLQRQYQQPGIVPVPQPHPQIAQPQFQAQHQHPPRAPTGVNSAPQQPPPLPVAGTPAVPVQQPFSGLPQNSLIVNKRQAGNPVLKHLRNVRWMWGDVVPDYLVGASGCALFLSLRWVM
uniref:ERCC1-like central domain-containing protein n=1 Tax=Dunaliella tertiolecta TaxID=3047 RepID=A0A7S3QZ10_DUNTE